MEAVHSSRSRDRARMKTVVTLQEHVTESARFLDPASRPWSEQRRPLNLICISSNPAVLTVGANDDLHETVFSPQAEAYGRPSGILFGISTSGASKNVLAAFDQAPSMGMHRIALTGEGRGRLADLSDFVLAIPSRSTPLNQQVHVCLHPYFRGEIERRLAATGEEPRSALVSV
jgi:D-sedoheptulose 7-phosphate isomerase